MRRRSRRTQLFGGGAAAIFVLLGWVDLTSNVQMVGLSSAALSIPYVNPPPKNNADKRLVVTPVALFERLTWGNKLPHDLDIWTQCYNLVNGQKSNLISIGYLRKSDLWLDLSRDIQGGLTINEENLQSNSHAPQVPPNTFCRFNVHLYHTHGGTLPVEGRLLVIQNKDGDEEKLLGDVSFKLVAPGQEVTLLTVTWDARGNPITDAIDRYPSAETVPIATAPRPSVGPSGVPPM